MTKLSERIQIIIDTLSKRVSSMEESAQDCANYTSFIGELYTLYNTVLRMETKEPRDDIYFEKTTLFVISIEKQIFLDI